MGCQITPRCSFDFISLVIIDAEHLLMCLMAFCVPSLELYLDLWPVFLLGLLLFLFLFVFELHEQFTCLEMKST